jgi:hypothetical protein
MQWIMTPNRQPLRLPLRGPSLPTSGPMLFFVTENHQFNVWYFRSYVPSLQILSCSLIFNDAARDIQNNTVHDTKVGPSGVRLCINAAIGLAYRGAPQFSNHFFAFTLTPGRKFNIDSYAISSLSVCPRQALNYI